MQLLVQLVVRNLHEALEGRTVPSDLGHEVIQDLALVEAKDRDGFWRGELGQDLADDPVHVAEPDAAALLGPRLGLGPHNL